MIVVAAQSQQRVESPISPVSRDGSGRRNHCQARPQTAGITPLVENLGGREGLT